MWVGFVTIWFWVGDQHEQTMGNLEIILLYRQEYLLLFFQLCHCVWFTSNCLFANAVEVILVLYICFKDTVCWCFVCLNF